MSDTVKKSSETNSKGIITKVTAYLDSYESGRFTRLGRTLNRITKLSDMLEKMKNEAKAEAKEHIADLFTAEEAACTRVIETVGFVFTISKDPDPTKTVKYAKVLEELQAHLTPELKAVMEGLVEKHTTITQREPSLLKAKDRKIEEGVYDAIKGIVSKVADWTMRFLNRYDERLAKLKAEVGITESQEASETEYSRAISHYNDVLRNGGNIIEARDMLIKACH